MRHWIIDLISEPLPSWTKAMPSAKLVGRNQLGTIASAAQGLVWCRVRSGELVSDVLNSVVPALGGKPLVVLSDTPDEAIVMQALSAGAVGCCNTNAAPEVLKQVALVVINGGLWVGQNLLTQLVGNTARVLAGQVARSPDDWSALLSEREVEVARLVAGGASNKEVARQLAITERTVKAHLTAVFEKLNLRDRLQLSLRINGLAL